MNTRVVRNGMLLDQRHDNIARMLRRGGYDPTQFGYSDQAIDPRATSGDDPWLRTYEGGAAGFTTRLRLPDYNGPWLSWLRARVTRWIARRSTSRSPAHAKGPAPRRPATGPTRPRRPSSRGRIPARLGEQPAGRPWCAHLSYLRPHPPFVVPEPYNTLYDPADPLPFARRRR